MRTCTAILGFWLCLSVTLGTAFAQSAKQVVSSVTPEQFATILTQGGHPAEVKSIDSVKYIEFEPRGPWKPGFKAYAQLFPPGPKCCVAASLFKMITPEHIKMATINDWNRKKHFLRAALRSDGTVILDSDFVIGGGVTPDNINLNVDIFGSGLLKFARETLGE